MSLAEGSGPEENAGAEKGEFSTLILRLEQGGLEEKEKDNGADPRARSAI